MKYLSVIFFSLLQCSALASKNYSEIQQVLQDTEKQLIEDRVRAVDLTHVAMSNIRDFNVDLSYTVDQELSIFENKTNQAMMEHETDLLARFAKLHTTFYAMFEEIQDVYAPVPDTCSKAQENHANDISKHIKDNQQEISIYAQNLEDNNSKMDAKFQKLISDIQSKLSMKLETVNAENLENLFDNEKIEYEKATEIEVPQYTKQKTTLFSCGAEHLLQKLYDKGSEWAQNVLKQMKDIQKEVQKNKRKFSFQFVEILGKLHGHINEQEQNQSLKELKTKLGEVIEKSKLAVLKAMKKLRAITVKYLTVALGAIAFLVLLIGCILVLVRNIISTKQSNKQDMSIAMDDRSIFDPTFGGDYAWTE